MSTYRIYVDSRDRQPGGKPEEFTYALPYSLNIIEKSLANIDAVVIPNSIPTVIEGVNDTIYMRENDPLETVWFREPKIAPGYYTTLDSLKQAIQEALNNGTHMAGTYTVTYDERLARFKFSNSAQRLNWYFVIFSQETQLRAEDVNITTIPRPPGPGAWRLLGMVNNPTLVAKGSDPVVAEVASGSPILQFATQLFIKTSLGIAGRSVGAKGNMSISRRVIMDQPTLSLVVDRHATSWDSFQISAKSLISTFTVALTDYNNNVIDLNGNEWSFSITIFRED